MKISPSAIDSTESIFSRLGHWDPWQEHEYYTQIMKEKCWDQYFCITSSSRSSVDVDGDINEDMQEWTMGKDSDLNRTSLNLLSRGFRLSK